MRPWRTFKNIISEKTQRPATQRLARKVKQRSKVDSQPLYQWRAAVGAQSYCAQTGLPSDREAGAGAAVGGFLGEEPEGDACLKPWASSGRRWSLQMLKCIGVLRWNDHVRDIWSAFHLDCSVTHLRHCSDSAPHRSGRHLGRENQYYECSNYLKQLGDDTKDFFQEYSKQS